jgi:hypothetical protein
MLDDNLRDMSFDHVVLAMTDLLKVTNKKEKKFIIESIKEYGYEKLAVAFHEAGTGNGEVAQFLLDKFGVFMEEKQNSS